MSIEMQKSFYQRYIVVAHPDDEVPSCTEWAVNSAMKLFTPNVSSNRIMRRRLRWCSASITR